MAHIKEPDGVDFIIKSEPLTKEERAAISEYIRNYKAGHSSKPLTKKRDRHTRKNNPV
jgi:hypothetical protein